MTHPRRHPELREQTVEQALVARVHVHVAEGAVVPEARRGSGQRGTGRRRTVACRRWCQWRTKPTGTKPPRTGARQSTCASHTGHATSLWSWPAPTAMRGANKHTEVQWGRPGCLRRTSPGHRHWQEGHAPTTASVTTRASSCNLKGPAGSRLWPRATPGRSLGETTTCPACAHVAARACTRGGTMSTALPMSLRRPCAAWAAGALTTTVGYSKGRLCTWRAHDAVDVQGTALLLLHHGQVALGVGVRGEGGG